MIQLSDLGSEAWSVSRKISIVIVSGQYCSILGLCRLPKVLPFFRAFLLDLSFDCVYIEEIIVVGCVETLSFKFVLFHVGSQAPQLDPVHESNRNIANRISQKWTMAGCGREMTAEVWNTIHRCPKVLRKYRSLQMKMCVVPPVAK